MRRGWLLFAGAAGMVLAVATVGFAVVAATGWRTFLGTYTLTNLLVGLGYLACALTIAWFRLRNVIGVIFLVAGLGHLTTAAATTAALLAIHEGWAVPVLRSLATLATAAWQLDVTDLALLLFPTGRLPSRRWLPVGLLIGANAVYQLVTGVLAAGNVLADPLLPGTSTQATSILSVGLTTPEPLNAAVAFAWAVASLLMLASLVWRYVRGDERIRRQLLWLILALLIILVLNLQRFATGDGPVLFLLSLVFIPITITIAIVRYQLFDIRLVLSRTLLYGLTLSVVVAAYAGIVAGFSLVSAGSRNTASTAAVIIVAIGFTPLRLLLQRAIVRAFYGTRSDPVATARRVGDRLREDDLADALERTRRALRLPGIALRREPAGNHVVVAGEPFGHGVAEIPLVYLGDLAGTLVVALRRGEGRLHEKDRRTLELIATPLAVALHAIALSEQVQQARAATVEAAAGERVRLQRELHDGLGPTLTGITFRTDAVANLIRSDTDEAERLLGKIRSDLRDVLDHMRRVVHGLRPIELDDLGLVGALNQAVTGLPAVTRRGISVAVDAPCRLPPLSAATELAAYRVANEALANVLRHSAGRNCVITLLIDGSLVVIVRDDGSPAPSWRPGLGLRSIADRAEELGGSATAGPTADGWEVHARFPLPTA